MPNNRTNVLESEERKQLQRVQRFLLHIAEPAIAGKAALVGYDEVEHKEGWRLLRGATGMDRPFSHFLSSAELAVASSDNERTRNVIHELDTFENLWFPRVRTAIQRFVKPDHRDAVATAFFDGLAQQPEGPEVVGSVEKLLERLKGLKASDKPGAKDAYAALVKKGLDDASLAHVTALIADARALAPAKTPTVPEAEQAEADQKQRADYEALKLWYQDWAEALRTELTHNELVKIGVRRVRGRPSKAPAVDDAGDADDI